MIVEFKSNIYIFVSNLEKIVYNVYSKIYKFIIERVC